MPQIVTLIPAGSKLLGIEISGGLATVDLSAEFASLSPDDAWDGGAFSLRGRLAQVVYTLTQFTTVDRVNFKLEGKPVKVLFGMADPDGSSEKIVLDKPVTRATYRDHYLPLIFVDRPAWGAALLNPGRVTGLANVFEAQFRIALLDRNDKVLVDVPVVASRHGLLGPIRRDPVVRRVQRPVGNAAGLGHLGVHRQAGRPCASIRSTSGRRREVARRRPTCLEAQLPTRRRSSFDARRRSTAASSGPTLPEGQPADGRLRAPERALWRPATGLMATGSRTISWACCHVVVHHAGEAWHAMSQRMALPRPCNRPRTIIRESRGAPRGRGSRQSVRPPRTTGGPTWPHSPKSLRKRATSSAFDACTASRIKRTA